MLQTRFAYGIRFALIVLAASLVAGPLALRSPAAHAAAAVTARVNTGAGAYTEPNGVAWRNDSGYSGGLISKTTSGIANTSNDRLFQSLRYNMSAYSLPVTAGQRYRVRLFFSENYFTARGKRVFDVSAEGVTVARGIDVYAAAGHKRAYARSFEVPVGDGQLNLRFRAVVNLPILAGIEAVPVGAIEPAPPAPTPTDGTLTWAPPTLSNPITVNVSNSNHELSLSNSRDYVIHMPATKLSVLGGLRIEGGHNVVLIGGAITIPAWGESHDTDNRGLYLAGQTGTVHIEGLLIDNSGGALSEGININAPDAIVQIQNVRIEGVHAQDEVNYSDNHSDIIQAWGGAKALRIDHLSGTTDYQGLFLVADWGTLPTVDLRNVNLGGIDSNPDLAQYLIWVDESTTTSFTMNNVWVRPGHYSLANTVWPDVDAGGTGRAVVDEANSTVSWPDSSYIHGTVNGGVPSGGDFVPSGTTGTAYSSPGYAA
jgi:hypothetical protein